MAMSDAKMLLSMSDAGIRLSHPSDLRLSMNEVSAQIGRVGSEGCNNLSIGNPALIPEVSSMWQECTVENADNGMQALSASYGLSAGEAFLTSAIVEHFNECYGWNIKQENVVIGTGSQLLICAAVNLSCGDVEGVKRNLILPSIPEYTGYNGLSMGNNEVHGVRPIIKYTSDELYEYEIDLAAIKQLKNVGAYLMSNPSNPSGRASTHEEICALANMAKTQNAILIVDNAYGEPFPQIAKTKTAPVFDDNIINSFSMSKAGIPGERIGFVIADEKWAMAIASFIANVALHAPRYFQAVASQAISTGKLSSLSENVISPYYTSKRRKVESHLRNLLDPSVPLRFYNSTGGMFCWIHINQENFDSYEFHMRLREQNTFVMPGRFFFPENEQNHPHARQCFRISLTADIQEIFRGLEVIAEVLEHECNELVEI